MSDRRSRFLDALDNRVLIFDGGMGTMLNTYTLSLDADYGGAAQENNHEILNLRRPDVIAEIHARYLKAGADAVETNTFSATRISQSDFPDMADKAYELNLRAARIAREVCDAVTAENPAKPRFVVGACGPTNKMITVGTAETVLGFDAFHAAYVEQVRGLVDGGADVILFETSFDILALKAGIIAAGDVFREKGVRLPLMAQVAFVKPTDEAAADRMLCGADMATVVATLEDFDHLDIIGMNCATGPDDMSPHIHHLCKHSRKRVSVLPNAGLPRMEKGRTFFPMEPGPFTKWIREFVETAGVNIVGGCCGTNDKHIAAVAAAVGTRAPLRRNPVVEHAVSSLTQSVALKQDQPPLLVGERTNSKGSKKFNRLMLADDLDGMAKVGVEQVKEGAHVLDVCVAEVGRKDAPTMNRVVERFRQSITIPLMIDTTEIDCVEEALKRYPGKAIINSINLEDGRSRMDRVVRLARRYNAAMVALTIDEDQQAGMARTVGRKVEIARRIHDVCVGEFGVKPEDLLFDVLTFTLATGREEDRIAGISTLQGIRAVKEALPGVGTILGLSNISFGFKPAARVVLNSVFMHEALRHGLDAAIVHVSQILPLARLDERKVESARRLVFNEWVDGKDPLTEFLALFTDEDDKKGATRKVAGTIEEVLKQRIIDGDRPGIEADLDLARQSHPPLDIINKILLDGMKVVGDLFGAGKMQLPFVLQSAETMKAAVGHLEKFMEKSEGRTKGRLVLATVKGDVHDIGKNLVDIILTNNGYSVCNIGIKQPVTAVLDAAEKFKADAVGLSGLLVKSTVVMREDLEELNRRGKLYPVMLGGAALTRRYVEEDLVASYKGNVFYCRDAFDGLKVMDTLMSAGATGPTHGRREWPTLRGEPPAPVEAAGDPDLQDRPERVERGWRPAVAPAGARSDTPPAPDVPTPPFWGARAVTDIPLDEIYGFINRKYLFRQQWQFSKGTLPHEEFLRREREIVEPIFARTTARWRDEGVLQPKVVYGYFPANADGDDVIVFDPETGKERVRFTFPRQPAGRHLCIADYFLPVTSGKRDVLAAHCVTVGEEPGRVEKILYAAADYREYLYLHGLSVETTEALAEYWHKRIRAELGIAGDDSPDLQRLFQQKYRGSRFSFGYPACPNLEDQRQLFELLEPHRIGVSLTEEFQLEPEQSTSAIIVHHPAAKYFNIK